MRRVGRVGRIAAAGLALAAMLLPSVAAAAEPTKEQCAGASESAQKLRKSGKLRDARAELLVCASKSCPGAVRDDCAQLLAEVDKALPTIVFVVQGADGGDLSVVKITMDGAPLVERLSGGAIAVDPGEHAFVFESEGFARAEKTIFVHEGDKDRRERVVMQPTAKPAAPPPASPAPPPATVAPDAASPSRPLRTAGFVAGAAGVVALGVGAFFGIQAISKNSDASCDSNDVCAHPQSRRDAQGAATISTVAFVAGAALAAAGVALVLVAPKGERPDAARVTAEPIVGRGAGGFAVSGRW